jgi:hypothetical protein
MYFNVIELEDIIQQNTQGWLYIPLSLDPVAAPAPAPAPGCSSLADICPALLIYLSTLPDK